MNPNQNKVNKINTKIKQLKQDEKNIKNNNRMKPVIISHEIFFRFKVVKDEHPELIINSEELFNLIGIEREQFTEISENYDYYNSYFDPANDFMKCTRKQFKKYLIVQASGKFDMISGVAQDVVNVDDDTYIFIQNNYNKLTKIFNLTVDTI